jgi:hypothetical protein
MSVAAAEEPLTRPKTVRSPRAAAWRSSRGHSRTDRRPGHPGRMTRLAEAATQIAATQSAIESESWPADDRDPVGSAPLLPARLLGFDERHVLWPQVHDATVRVFELGQSVVRQRGWLECVEGSLDRARRAHRVAGEEVQQGRVGHDADPTPGRGDLRPYSGAVPRHAACGGSMGRDLSMLPLVPCRPSLRRTRVRVGYEVRSGLDLTIASRLGLPQAADLRTRDVDVRRSRLPAQRDQVALPDRRVPARLPLDQGRPAAPAHPAQFQPLGCPVPGPRRRRARVRAAQERVGVGSASRPWSGSDAAARRPDDPRQGPRVRSAGREPCRSRLTRSGSPASRDRSRQAAR